MGLKTSQKPLRIVSRVDIKGENVIKGVHLEGLRVVGSADYLSKKYYESGADEILYIDAVASLYQRNHLAPLLKSAATNAFIPITAGGGIRSVADARDLLRSGADKIAINTAALQNPHLLRCLCEEFGEQCVVLSVQAKKVAQNKWEPFSENGREPSGRCLNDWLDEANEQGFGELLLTSIDREGTKNGFDTDLLEFVSKKVITPIIVSGGMGALEHVISAHSSGADAVAVAGVIHRDEISIGDIKSAATSAGIMVRRDAKQ